MIFFPLNRYRLLSTIVFGLVLFIIVILLTIGHMKHHQRQIIVHVDPPLIESETNRYTLLKSQQHKLTLKQKTKRHHVQVIQPGRILNPLTQTIHSFCFDCIV
jgi:hypothetical protein